MRHGTSPSEPSWRRCRSPRRRVSRPAATTPSFLARARVPPAFLEVADAVDADLYGLYRRLVDLLRDDGAIHPGNDTDLLPRELQALAEGLAFQLVTWPHRYSPIDARQVVARWLDALCDPPAPGK
nr:TetR family transcriptional regulator C-terminal domain-containing protein [Geodermatophilus sp. TF02-6]